MSNDHLVRALAQPVFHVRLTGNDKYETAEWYQDTILGRLGLTTTMFYLVPKGRLGTFKSPLK